jgi:hypothetical protein
MKASRELDALVAEKVMGLKQVHRAYDLGEPVTGELYFDNNQDWGTVPFYSTDIAAAWSVIDHLIALASAAMDQPYFELRTCGSYYTAVWDTEERDWPTVTEDADTAPLAICLAALKAVGVEASNA